MKDPRPTWDDWGVELAMTVARRADCSRRQVGAVIMTPDHRIVATGYNGAPAGSPGCLTAGACPRGQSGVAPGSSYDTGAGACIALHAEQNALLRASWTDMVGSTLYVTDHPCDGCFRMIVGTPIERFIGPGFAWERRH
jgi:dCMP deaminase